MPNEKRARHKAARQARMVELRQAQQRRRNLKRGVVVAIAVAIALVLARSAAAFHSHHKKKTVATKGATTTTTARRPPPRPSRRLGQPVAAGKVEAGLVARTPPAKSADCNAATSPCSLTDDDGAGKGNAVAIVAAPAEVGFPDLNGSSPHYTKFSSAPPFCIDVDKTYYRHLRPDGRDVHVELLPKYAPRRSTASCSSPATTTSTGSCSSGSSRAS